MKVLGKQRGSCYNAVPFFVTTILVHVLVLVLMHTLVHVLVLIITPHLNVRQVMTSLRSELFGRNNSVIVAVAVTFFFLLLTLGLGIGGYGC